MTDGYEILKSLYHTSENQPSLENWQMAYVETILANAESHKGILTVLITSLVKKIETPSQDIRLHKKEFVDGYSGRGYDTRYITPFLRDYFPRFAMAESGWLTRSIEQPYPFTKDFGGKIRNTSVKTAFLEIIHDVQENSANPRNYLLALLSGLKSLQESHFEVKPLQTSRITVQAILALLEIHFNHQYKTSGASRLPVLALYSVYQILMALPRYKAKQLLSLKSQTTADTKSRNIGDIEIVDDVGNFFEALEIKLGKSIDLGMVQIAFDKIRDLPIERYYLLTTKSPNTEQTEAIQSFCLKVLSEHGCEIIVNGVIPTLKYYLRLLPYVATFLDNYTAILQTEFASGSIKSVHLEKWQSLINENNT